MVNILLWSLGVSASWGLYIYLCMIACALFGSLAYVGTPIGYKVALSEMLSSIDIQPIAMSAMFLFVVLLLFGLGGMV